MFERVSGDRHRCGGRGLRFDARRILSLFIVIGAPWPMACTHADSRDADDGGMRETDTSLAETETRGEDDGEPNPRPDDLDAPVTVSFDDVTTVAGLEQPHRPDADGIGCIFSNFGATYPPTLDCSIQLESGGAAIADFDGDGWVDLFLPRRNLRPLLYRNLGDGRFEDVAQAWGLDEILTASGATWSDLDRDGDLDLVVTTQGLDAHRIYRRDESRFVAVEGPWKDAFASTLGVNGTSVQAMDYDLDGYPDLLFMEWLRNEHKQSDEPWHARLLHNTSATTGLGFEDVTLAVGLEQLVNGTDPQLTFSASSADFDTDGWPDLLLTADYGHARIFLGDGETFTLVPDSGLEAIQFGMGTAVADIDGDGDLDAYVSSIGNNPETDIDFGFPWDQNHVLLNRGDGTFENMTATGAERCSFGWGVLAADLDLDGNVDLASTNGWFHPDPILDALYDSDRSCVFIRDAKGPDQLLPTFADRSWATGFTDRGQGRGLYPLDFDRDGDLDILEVRNGDAPILWQTRSSQAHAWLQVEVLGEAGTADQRQALVALRMEPDGPWRIETIGQNSTYLGHGELIAAFGLGRRENPVDVRVCWPDLRLIKQISAVDVRQRLRVGLGGSVEAITEPCGVAILRD